MNNSSDELNRRPGTSPTPAGKARPAEGVPASARPGATSAPSPAVKPTAAQSVKPAAAPNAAKPTASQPNDHTGSPFARPAAAPNAAKPTASQPNDHTGSPSARPATAPAANRPATSSGTQPATAPAANRPAAAQTAKPAVAPTAKPAAPQPSNPATAPNPKPVTARPAASSSKSVAATPFAPKPAVAPNAKPAAPQANTPTARPEAARPASQPAGKSAAPKPASEPEKSVSRPDKKPRPEKPTPKAGTTAETPSRGLSARRKKAYSTREELKKRMGRRDPGGNTVLSLVKAIAYIVFVTVAGAFLSVFIINVTNDMFAFVKQAELVDVTIPADATIDDVAQVLYDNGVIKYPKVFSFYGNIRHDDGSFVAGDYTVSTGADYDDLRAAFKEQDKSGQTERITIPEGFTTDEIIDLFVSYGIGTRDGFVDAINNGKYDYWFVDELNENGWSSYRYYRLDGYLFPDTYDFYLASSEWTVVNKLLRRFSQIYTENMRTKAESLNLTTDQVVTLASMVEKEAYYASDMVVISSVFHNRLNNVAVFPLLQSDATIMYAMQHERGTRPSASEVDVNYKSPYNTYLYKGLPPGPIASPGYSALAAALNPSKTNYYYFVSYDTGYTLYATTRAEHDLNVAMVKDNQSNDPDAEK